MRDDELSFCHGWKRGVNVIAHMRDRVTRSPPPAASRNHGFVESYPCRSEGLAVEIVRSVRWQVEDANKILCVFLMSPRCDRLIGS